MKTIVITGSTRGIGLGLAEAFLARSCNVVLSGRSQSRLQSAAAELSTQFGEDRVFAFVCDVSDFSQVQSLWDAAQAHFGQIDIWINNAGAAHPLEDFVDQAHEKFDTVISGNILGTMYGTQIAYQAMRAQGFGAIYNMEGFGSNGGRKLRGLTLYGTSKAAVRYFNDSMFAETAGGAVILGAISPGMVVTDLLLQQRTANQQGWESSKKVFNILADRVETVTPWIADQILFNTQHGKRITWLTGMKVMLRFLTAPFSKRRVVPEKD